MREWAERNGLFIREFLGLKGFYAAVGPKEILGEDQPDALPISALVDVATPGYGKTREKALRDAIATWNSHQLKIAQSTGEPTTLKLTKNRKH